MTYHADQGLTEKAREYLPTATVLVEHAPQAYATNLKVVCSQCDVWIADGITDEMARSAASIMALVHNTVKDMVKDVKALCSCE